MIEGIFNQTHSTPIMSLNRIDCMIVTQMLKPKNSKIFGNTVAQA